MDPLHPIFGEASRALFSRERLHLVHGDLERLPSWMRSSVLTDIPGLCKRYQGVLEVARGKSGEARAGLEYVGSGGQVRVTGTRPEALLSLGLTVYFAEMEANAPESSPFLRALEASLGVPTRTTTLGMFVNAPGSGLPMHHDSHDQLLIQLSGKKKFTYIPERVIRHPGIPFAPGSIAHPEFGPVYRRGFPIDMEGLEQSDGQTVELGPGSAFFMPAGTLHCTTDQDELSVSLVLAVRPPSLLDLVLKALRYELGQLPELRAPAYGYFATSGLNETGAVPLELVRDAVRSLDPHGFARAWKASLQREGGLSEVPEVPFLEYLRIPSTLVRFAELADGRVELRVRPVNSPEEQVLELAAPARRIVDYLVSTHAAVSVAELCRHFEEFEEDEIRTLIVQLGRVGLLRPLPYPLRLGQTGSRD
jgi:quercetin dioxygenase-like cupin family protein